MPNLDDPPTPAPAGVPQDPALAVGPSDKDWDAWCNEHYRMFTAFAMSVCRQDRALAEDIVQEVAVELWQKEDALPGKSLVFLKIRQRAADHYRLNMNSLEGTLSPDPTESYTEMWDRLCARAGGYGEGFPFEEEEVNEVNLKLLRVALAGLPEPERRVIEARYFGEKPKTSWDAVASAMGCSPYHAEKRCAIALRHLTSRFNSIFNR